MQRTGIRDHRTAQDAASLEVFALAVHDQLLLNRLLATLPTQRDMTVEPLSETVAELRHAGDHILSAVKRLTVKFDDAA